MLHYSYAPTFAPLQLCSITVMLHYGYAPLRLCSITVMLHYGYAPLQLCSITVMLHYSHAPLQLCSITVMLHYSYAPLQLCSITVMLHYGYAPTFAPLQFVGSLTVLNLIVGVSINKVSDEGTRQPCRRVRCNMLHCLDAGA